MTLAAQCYAASFSVPCGAATVMERGSIEFFNILPVVAGVRRAFFPRSLQ